jgi:Ca-activated chloride channel homolog
MTSLGSTRRWAGVATAVAVFVVSLVCLDAQQVTFKSGIEMVPLVVTVTDTNGRYVTGLTGDDFTVLEDGVVQRLSFFASGAIPLDVALVVDTSSSMVNDLPLVQSAAAGLVHRLRATDRGAIVEVKGSIGMPQPFTSDVSRIEQTLRSLKASGNTALYDGLYVILKEFERERHDAAQLRRQVLVVLSDGVDTGSHVAFEDVLNLARRTGVGVYIIALRSDIQMIPREHLDESILHADYAIATFTRESGGRTFFPKSARELPAIYNAIAQELGSQYDLGYLPLRAGGDGGFRRVAVHMPPQMNALARTRSGYYATRSNTER